MILTSKNNPLVKETAALKEKKTRKQLGLFLVEGSKMTAECKKSGLEIERIILSESYSGDLEGVRVSDEVFKYLSDEKTPQGVLCRVKLPERKLVSPTGSCLLLDGVSDPGNMGAIIRTANAAGYRQLYLADCTDPYSPKSVRASMSGIFFTELYIGSRAEILSALGDAPLIAADMDGVNAFSFSPPEKFALVIGNEANGISDEVFARAKNRVRIPMESTQESLNAAVSAGVLMYLMKKDQFSNK